MQALTPKDLLVLWERGQGLHPVDRGLLAIHVALPETQAGCAADWPLGQRNLALARLRCASFGTTLSGWTTCRECDGQLEFDFDARRLLEGEPPASPHVVVDGRTFRLPTSRDLARLAQRGGDDSEDDDLAMRLAEQCCIEGERGLSFSVDELETIGARIADADPYAEIALDLACPACGAMFQETLDLAAFFWNEVEARARRLLLDVHTLARAYGWSEPQILALTPARRAFYLDMVQA